MEEIWKDIPGFEGMYQVSSLGNVRSVDRYVMGKHKERFMRGRNIKKSTGRSLYLSLTLSKNNVHISYFVHSLVASAFLGKKKDGYVVNHKDGDKFNNRLSNIEYVNYRENASHARLKNRKNMAGAYLNKKTRKWYSRVYFMKKMINLGTYNTQEEATSAYLNFLKTNNMENKYAL